MGNCNGIDLKQLCIVPSRLCWVVYVDVVVLEHHGNVFDAVCLGTNACFKTLEIPSLSIKNAEQYAAAEDEDGDNAMDGGGAQADTLGLFQNTEITKKATISKMRQLQRQRTSKFSGQDLPFQTSMAMDDAATISTATQSSDGADGGKSKSLRPVESRDIAEIEFEVEGGRRGQRLEGRDMLPIVVTMAIMDESRYFIVDPLYEEELCCDLLIRIAVYSNGHISVIKSGEKAIDSVLIFGMIGSGKESGLKWQRQMEGHLDLKQGAESEVGGGSGGREDGDLDLLKISTFSLRKEEEKEVEEEMRLQMKALSFITESLRKEKGADGDAVEKQGDVEEAGNVALDELNPFKKDDSMSKSSKDSKSSTQKDMQTSALTSIDDDEDMIIID